MATTIVKERLIRCNHCGLVDKQAAFYQGRGKAFGEHGDHTYCPRCRCSITWYGATVVATLREVA